MIQLKRFLGRLIPELFSIDLRALAVLRTGMGILIVVDLWARSADLQAFYTDSGIFPRAAALDFFGRNAGWWSLHLFDGSVIYQKILFLTAGFFAVGLITGYQTRLATIVSWAFLVSLHARNYLLLNSGDVLLRMFLFWSIFLPLGQRWSLDSVFRPGKMVTSNQVCSVASAALLLQVAVMYFVAGFTKVNPVWTKGIALGYVFSLDGFSSNLGRYLLNWPKLLQATSQVIPWFELCGAFVPFVPIFSRRIRLILVILFVLFHTAIALFMKNLGLFPYISMLVWIPFLPAFIWDKIAFNRKQESGERPGVLALENKSEAAAERKGGPFSAYWRSVFISGVAAFFLMYTAILNLEEFEKTHCKKKDFKIIPSCMRGIERVCILYQRWHMFNMPASRNTWYLIMVWLKDGSLVDFVSGKQVVIDETSRVAANQWILKNYRWEKYFANIYDLERRKYWQYFLRDYCERWNSAHPGERKAKRLEVIRLSQNSYPAPSGALAKEFSIGQIQCDEKIPGSADPYEKK